MRSAAEIRQLILDVAMADERIRAVLLNGSRASKDVPPDVYQDFDIVFIVDNISSFTCNHKWTDIFGEKLIWQLPEEMSFGKEQGLVTFPYLMLFADGNRIDLTLFPGEKLQTHFHAESLTVVWLDKDNLFLHLPPSNNSDHFIKKPTQKEFSDTCNEFWWVSTYVAKGLARNQITYAKEMMEMVVRPMFMKMIVWTIGSENNFEVATGKAGKFMQQYLSQEDYQKILSTYANHQIEDNWRSLFIMTEMFSQFANKVSTNLDFRYNAVEEKNTLQYLEEVKLKN